MDARTKAAHLVTVCCDAAMFHIEELEELPSLTTLRAAIRAYRAAGWSLDDMEIKDMCVLVSDWERGARVDIPTLYDVLAELRTAAVNLEAT